MDKDEKAAGLIEKAENLGLRLEFRSGLIVAVKPREMRGPRTIIAELWKYPRKVRRLVERRAMAAGTNEFLGQRVWSEYGEGVLADASGDVVIISVNTGFRRSRVPTSNAGSLLVVLDESRTVPHLPTSRNRRSIGREFSNCCDVAYWRTEMSNSLPRAGGKSKRPELF